jgi:hypothetical protein
MLNLSQDLLTTFACIFATSVGMNSNVLLTSKQAVMEENELAAAKLRRHLET